MRAKGALVSVPVSVLLLWLVAPLQLDPAGFERPALANFAAVGLCFPATVTLLTFEANRRLGPNIAGALGNQRHPERPALNRRAPVVVAHLGGRTGWLTELGAHLYVWARVAYVPA